MDSKQQHDEPDAGERGTLRGPRVEIIGDPDAIAKAFQGVGAARIPPDVAERISKQFQWPSNTNRRFDVA